MWQKFGIIFFLCVLVLIVAGLIINQGAIVLLGQGLLIFCCWMLKDLRPYAFTFIIILAATSALYYPVWYDTIGNFQLTQLIIPILMIIMFGMGTSMELRDFKLVLQSPKGVLLGLLCQFSIMPLVGFGLASISKLPAEIAAGIILVGCSPSGLASNVMSYIAKANLALSLTLTMCATLLAPILTPLLMKVLAQQYVPIDFYSMFLSILKIVIIPIILGLIVNRLLRNNRFIIERLLPKVSMAGIVVIITIITSAGRDALLDIGLLLIAIVVLHNIAGYLLGYLCATLGGLDKKSRRTIALEVGMQNGGLASGIAVELGKVATMGLAPAVFGPFMNITGSSLASFWSRKK